MDQEQLKRIADAIEEILQLVKADQERSRKYMEDAAAIERQAKSEVTLLQIHEGVTKFHYSTNLSQSKE